MTDPHRRFSSLEPRDLAAGLFTGRLDNGLEVVIQRDGRSPVAVCNVWVKAGSNNEPEALRGWSHGIEHMLFKGTARRAEGDFAREVADAGGSTNAGTGYESTNYHITVPAEKLETAVDILGDALLGSVFEPVSLDAEREVLVHENHMYDDVPFGFGITWRWALELAFDASPYRHPIGGRDENLRGRSREEILSYWRSAYRPDNMAVVIVGDVDPAAAFALVSSRFGAPAADLGPGLPGTALIPDPPREQAHTACRLRIEEGDIQKTYAKLVFPTPGHGSGLRPVLGVIRQVLAEGRSSRFYRSLQEDLKLIDNFMVVAEGNPREGAFVIDLETDGERLAEAIRAVCGILADLKRDGPTPAELDRAKVRAVRGFLFGRETVQGQAHSLGRHLLLDDLAGAFAYPDRVAAVTADQVAALAGTVFPLEELSVVVYRPAGSAAAGFPADPAALQEWLEPHLGRRGTGPSGPAPDDTPPRARSAAGPAAARKARGFVTAALAGGVSVDYLVDPTLPVVSLALTTVGGAGGETAGTAGLSALACSAQVKGAGGLSAPDLHGRLEGGGAVVSPRIERDFGGLVFTGLSDRLDEPLDLLASIVGRPDFPAAEVEQERRLSLQELASLEDNPLNLGVVRLRALLYGDHPYGRPLVGTPESLPALTMDQVRRSHRDAWTRAALRVTVAGDFDPGRLLPRLEAIIASLPEGAGKALAHPGPILEAAGGRSERLQRRISQCVLLAGWPGASEPNDRRPARLLLQQLLNGQSGRLFEELRNRRSLCYNTGLISTSGFGQGMVLAYVLTDPASEQKARTALLDELVRLAADPAGDQELARAKAKLVGNLLIGNQSNSAKVSRASRNRVYGRSPDDLAELVAGLQACTAEEIAELAAEMLRPDERCEVVVAP